MTEEEKQYALQTKKANADQATANAAKAAEEARKAAGDADKALADARKAEADADKAKSDADKAAAEARKSETDAAKAAATSDADVRKAIAEADKATTVAAADTKKAVAEAEKAAREAAFPRGEAKPLEGKIDSDDKSGFIADLVSYKALNECGAAIGALVTQELKESASAKVLVVGALDFALGDYVRIQVAGQLGLFTTEFTEVLTRLNALYPPSTQQADLANILEGNRRTITSGGGAAAAQALVGLGTAVAGAANPAVLGLTAAASVVSLAADVAGYFLTDYGIKGRDVRVSNEVVTAAVAGAIEKPTYVLNFNLLNDSPVVTSFSGLLSKRQKGEAKKEHVRLKIARAAELKAALSKFRELLGKAKAEEEKIRLQTEIVEATSELNRIVPQLELAEAAVAEWQSLVATFDAYAKTVVTAETGGLSHLVTAAVMEKIHNDSITHLIWVKQISGGGESITSRSLWPFANGDIAYVGGACASFVLAGVESGVEGKVIASDTVMRVSRLKYDVGSAKVLSNGPIAQDWFDGTNPRGGRPRFKFGPIEIGWKP